MAAAELIFLKLGGSLITDKRTPHTAQTEILARLALEIAAARAERPDLRILIGHGSGSFGHVPAKKYGTRQGVHTADGWRGFVEVWREASLLNRLVMDALHSAGLPALAFPPSAGLAARDGVVESWNLEPLRMALEAGLVPVVFGDVIFDCIRGGTIFSTENVFLHLAGVFQPRHLLLAGIEPGVWADFPACQHLIPLITPQNFDQIASALSGSAATDVTGGMASKVGEMLDLVKSTHEMDAFILSGLQPGVVQRALLGEFVGTRIALYE